MTMVAVPPCGAIGSARSSRIIVSSTFGTIAAPPTVTSLNVYPPANPPELFRASGGYSMSPLLPGRNRFWSACIQMKRSVSGELLV